VIAGVVLLLPDLLLLQGLIAPKDRPVHAPVISRLLGLMFEVVIWLVVQRLVRSKSPLVKWFLSGPRGTSWVGRHRRLLSWTILAYLLGIVLLDAEGYSFTSHRVSIATGQAIALVAGCFAVYKLIVGTIDRHAWRWVRNEVDNGDPAHLACRQENMACRLRRLAAWVVPILGVAFGAWLWKFDPELLQYVADIHLWGRDPDLVRVGDLTKSIVILSITAAVWRYLTDFFTVAIFPRMTEDPGIRYAVLTLCRYLVLAIGTLSGLSAVHLGLDKIGMVLAALGVGLGFGLQEIV
jgi:potassium efflux system protein